jgi:hypothetical protein
MPSANKLERLRIREVPRKKPAVPRSTKSRKELISTLLTRMEKQLNSATTTKVTLADFIRLIQLQRELEQEEQPAEVIVTWKDRLERQDVEK